MVAGGRERRVDRRTGPVRHRVRDVRRGGGADRESRPPEHDRAHAPAGASFADGVLVHVRRGHHVRDRPGETGRWLVAFGLLEQLRVAVRDPPRRSSSCRCSSPMAGSPRRDGARSSGSSWGSWCSSRIDLTLGQPTLTGSTDAIAIANPLVRGRRRATPVAGSADRRLASRASSPRRSCRSSSGSGVRPASERLQIKWVVFGLLVALVGIIATELHHPRRRSLTAIVGGGRVPAVPALDRGRRSAVPSLRPGRRRP